MNQEIRNKLRNVVTQCRKLLEDSVSQELEGKYGIFARREVVTADPNAAMSHLSEEEQTARKDILDHFGHIKARGFKPKDALDQLVREIAFTHLNRLCAYKMMEAREVYVGGQKFREAVSRGINSNGVKFYLADHPEEERLFNTGHQDIAYRHFLDWLGGLLSNEIGVLFSPNDPANRLYPRQKVLDDVLDLLNGGGIKPDETELRAEWPKIWSQDETIGWVYQYFTPKELRDQARKESQAPRNSYELAFRNQFFTPRYVVEFLTDNTLGRIWFEMRKGNTTLKEQCRYMVRRPTELFLKKDEEPPKNDAEKRNDLSQEELLKQPVCIPHRAKKDPRELKVLDPACGSGHFLLYCFDLLQTIYEEAYADPDLGADLKQHYETLEDLRQDVPRLILANNLHGIDIDLRASQIAALALWLRCQRAYHDMGLKRNRAIITRSNLVSAEPMPGEDQLLKEFIGQLEPKFLGQVVEVVFDKMKLAGEVGPLLRIEEAIREAVAEAKKQWVRETALATDRKGQPLLFTQTAMDRLIGKPEQPSLFDLSDITDDQFFEQAEAKVVEALRNYAEKAQDGQQLKRRLFAEDTVRGFAFVDVCHKRFDVVLMNPPFGESSERTSALLRVSYPTWNDNLLCAFLERAWELIGDYGKAGAIYDRTALVKSTYEPFRRSHMIPDYRLEACADLGWEVLDANVEVTTSVLSKNISLPRATFVDVRSFPSDKKGEAISLAIAGVAGGTFNKAVSFEDPSIFDRFPNAVIGYDFPSFLRKAFKSFLSLSESGIRAYTGHQLKAEKHFRLWWEVSLARPPFFLSRMFNGATYSPYSASLRDCAIADCQLESLPKDTSTALRNKDKHYVAGVCYGKRGDFFCAHALPAQHMFTVEGQCFPIQDDGAALELIGFLNTPLVRFSLNRFCGQHKYSGYVNLMPYHALSDSGGVRNAVSSVLQAFHRVRVLDETQSSFAVQGYGPTLSSYADQIHTGIVLAAQESKNCESFCHGLVLESFKVPKEEREVLEQFRRKEPEPEQGIEDADLKSGCRWFAAHSILSHALGYSFGRFDIRFAIAESQPVEAYSPFAPLSSCPSGMLQRTDGSSLIASPDQYPLRIDWDGILVDDPDQQFDIVRRTRDVLGVIWNSNDELIEREACDSLGVRDLREYFRKPFDGGFWSDHIARYSKSRRKAPIYWLLQSSKKNYGVWLYYQKFDKDLLFKTLVNYVEPKIRLETNKLDSFRLLTQQSKEDLSGKKSKQMAKDIEEKEDFLSELRDFEDKLRRAANLNLEPDLNDGVVLNIAPLHELVPWKEAKNCWEELLDGNYEWSSIGKQLRQKGLVK